MTTKCTLQPYTEEKIRHACAYSSEKLQTDCIELYQLHGWDPKTPIADQLGVLAALQKEGKIKCEPLLQQQSHAPGPFLLPLIHPRRIHTNYKVELTRAIHRYIGLNNAGVKQLDEVRMMRVGAFVDFFFF